MSRTTIRLCLLDAANLASRSTRPKNAAVPSVCLVETADAVFNCGHTICRGCLASLAYYFKKVYCAY
ncbi:hypothetical protein LTR27_011931 [Elasticomyces elasticus]|nr:hypothetical protein LTR27_011931 [Elasticomyces elasticus]